ncbi:unnamed protein product [Urochloa humidicola]
MLELHWISEIVELSKCCSHILRYPEYPHGDTAAQRPRYQDAFGPVEQAEADARDKRAQRAAWDAHLRFYEVRKAVLKDCKAEMERRMKAVYDSLVEEQTNLGSGYANYDDPPVQ